MNHRKLQVAGTGLLTLFFVLTFAVAATSRDAQLRWLDSSGLNEVLLEREDLPSEWQSWNQYSYELEVDGGLGVARGFRRSESQPWVHITEQVYVYDGQATASGAYRDLLTKYSRFDFQGWEQLPFEQVESQADALHIACIETYINGFHHYACRFVALYGNLVVDLIANIFDDRWLTAEDFRAVVSAVDRKMVTALDD